MSNNHIDLETFEAFCQHRWVSELLLRYNRRRIRAKHSVAILIKSLIQINENYFKENERGIFTAVTGRVKEESRFLRKIYKKCRERQAAITREIFLEDIYRDIKDIAGVRFSTPYYDEVEYAIEKVIRPKLKLWGYGVDLRGEEGYEDNNYLDEGDEFGYRSYHFYIEVPISIDIYGEKHEFERCEVQGRTELQHIWAVRSHTLLYKPKTGFEIDDQDIIKTMEQISNLLRSVDHFLIEIRDRVSGE